MDETEPLNDSHDQVYPSTHVVRRKSPHKRVECRRGRADAHEEGDLDEDDDECARAGQASAAGMNGGAGNANLQA